MKVAGAATRSILRAVLRNGAEELIETASEYLSAKAEGNEAIEGAIEEVEEGMSKVAGHMIVTQLAAEQARQVELPQQIDALLEAVTEGREAKRVVILIDELDRCHPDYAIALLEAMKLVFGRPGFVFFLMVNADYLESIAHHRFGTKDAGENYLEKFVDLRLTLKAAQESTKSATTRLALELPLNIPFGEGHAFSVEAAANLAGSIASSAGLSFRQIKKVLSRVELALRCYREKPLDLSLLVFLAFADAARRSDGTIRFEKGLLPRAILTAEKADSVLKSTKQSGSARDEYSHQHFCENFVKENCAELEGLPDHRYRLDPPQRGGSHYEFYKVLGGLGPYYYSEHREILATVHKLMTLGP
jgi:KAP family P-loop domain